MKMSDTLNSLGTLRQRQRQYAEAETHYARSLEVRRALGEGKEKWQLVAQSLVSLGNLAIRGQLVKYWEDKKTHHQSHDWREKHHLIHPVAEGVCLHQCSLRCNIWVRLGVHVA